MNISTFASRCVTSQINRIEEGFRFHGHIINECKPDLVYANDIGHWNQALALYSQFPNSKCILTVLDLPTHLPEDCAGQVEKVKEVKENWPEVKICTISKKVQSDVLELCGVESTVIYQPIKDITNLGIGWKDRKIDYLVVGRNHDKGKGHLDVTIPAIVKMHGDISKLYTVGEGFLGAHNLGQVSDDQLNTIYNNTKYVFCPSSFEGLGLQLIESFAAGAIPISYRWHPTAAEFINKRLIFNSVDDIIEFIGRNQMEYFDLENNIDKFRKEQIAENILNVAKI